MRPKSPTAEDTADDLSRNRWFLMRPATLASRRLFVASKTSIASIDDDATAPKTPDGRELRSVTLPDLSQMAPSAQKQIRDQYASLDANDRRITRRSTELSNAYGDMGKLLMAAQYSRPGRSLSPQRADRSIRASSAGRTIWPISIERRATS